MIQQRSSKSGMVTYAYVHLNPTYLSRARAWLLVYCTYGYLVIGYKTAA